MWNEYKILTCAMYEYTSIEANIEWDGDVKCRIRFERSEYTPGDPLKPNRLRHFKDNKRGSGILSELFIYKIYDKTNRDWRKPDESEILSNNQILKDCWQWAVNNYLKKGIEFPVEAWSYSDYIEIDESDKYNDMKMGDDKLCLTSNFGPAYWVHLKYKSGSENNYTLEDVIHFNYDEFNCEENLMDKKDALCLDAIEWIRKYPVIDPQFSTYAKRKSDHYSG